jgi:hypothetical protein
MPLGIFLNSITGSYLEGEVNDFAKCCYSWGGERGKLRITFGRPIVQACNAAQRATVADQIRRIAEVKLKDNPRNIVRARDIY